MVDFCRVARNTAQELDGQWHKYTRWTGRGVSCLERVRKPGSSETITTKTVHSEVFGGPEAPCNAWSAVLW